MGIRRIGPNRSPVSYESLLHPELVTHGNLPVNRLSHIWFSIWTSLKVIGASGPVNLCLHRATSCQCQKCIEISFKKLIRTAPNWRLMKPKLNSTESWTPDYSCVCKGNFKLTFIMFCPYFHVHNMGNFIGQPDRGSTAHAVYLDLSLESVVWFQSPSTYRCIL